MHGKCLVNSYGLFPRIEDNSMKKKERERFGESLLNQKMQYHLYSLELGVSE